MENLLAAIFWITREVIQVIIYSGMDEDDFKKKKTNRKLLPLQCFLLSLSPKTEIKTSCSPEVIV